MARPSPHRLLVFRSGPTEWDVLGRVQGATDLPISASGLSEIQQTLAALENQRLDVVACAPDEASQTTARLLAERTGARRATVVPALADMRLGLWEGLRYEELESRFCRAGRQFLDDPSGIVAPEGEGLEAFAERVGEGLVKALSRRKPGAAIGLVVRPLAHGVIRCRLNAAPMCDLWQMIREGPGHEWYLVEPGDPRMSVPPRGPRRSASAA